MRRGFLLEELARGVADEEMRSEMFICGVFSLLDTMMGQPFEQLLKSIPVPQDVFDALVQGTGRYRSYLDLVRAVEHESLFDIREAAETLMLSAAEVDRKSTRLNSSHRL